MDPLDWIFQFFEEGMLGQPIKLLCLDSGQASFWRYNRYRVSLPDSRSYNSRWRARVWVERDYEWWKAIRNSSPFTYEGEVFRLDEKQYWAFLLTNCGCKFYCGIVGAPANHYFSVYHWSELVAALRRATLAIINKACNNRGVHWKMSSLEFHCSPRLTPRSTNFQCTPLLQALFI
jgi:hypothetical protein